MWFQSFRGLICFSVVVCVAACASTPEEVPQQAKKLCVSPVQTALVEPSSSSQLPLTNVNDEPVCPAWLDSLAPESTLSEEDQGQYDSVLEELEALLQSSGGESLVEPSSSSQTDSDDDDDEPVCPAKLCWKDSPEDSQTETESTLSEEDQRQYETMAEELEALLQSPGGESQLPQHTELYTLDLHHFY